jgi:hypothetical protein
MSLVALVITLIVVGVGLWAVNRFGAEFIDAKILRVINIVVVLCVVVWLLSVFGLLSSCNNVQVPKVNG